MEAITSFGIGGIFRALGMLIFGGISGILSRKIFTTDHTAPKVMLLSVFFSLVFIGLAYLLAIPFFEHPISGIGTIAVWIIVISWIIGLWERGLD